MACGIDFGTSNSTVGLVISGQPQLLAVEGSEPTIPTALFFEADTGQPTYGRAAINDYIEGHEGRFMRALKSILGSSLIDERTQVGKRTLPFRDIIAMFLRHLRTKAGAPDSVVLGRPVFFVDHDTTADTRAQSQLENAALIAGFKHVSFQYEPIAAAFDYEQQVSREELLLVADIGGGTTDFSVVRVSPSARGKAERAGDILASYGVHVGGTDFDRVLSMATIMPHLGLGSLTREKELPMPVAYYADLATWHKIPFLYTPRTRTDLRELKDMAAEPEKLARFERVVQQHLGHQLLFKAEAAKISLSANTQTSIDLALIEPGLSVKATQAGFEAAATSLTEKISAAVAETLRLSGTKSVNTIAFTGGASRMPMVRSAIAASLPTAKLHDSAALTSVGTGLALEAARRFC